MPGTSTTLRAGRMCIQRTLTWRGREVAAAFLVDEQRATRPASDRKRLKMNVRSDEREEAKVAYATLIRLANSCEREAGRGKTVTPIGSDLNDDDLRTIADILRKFAATIAQEAG